MRYYIDQEIFSRFPNFRRVVVLADNINNQGENKDLEELLRKAEENVRGGALAAFPDLLRLNIWVEAFRSLNINPKKHPPSVLNMIKRVRGGKNLPYINNLVAIFNCLSLNNQLSCGGDDLAVVNGDLALTVSDGTENYTPLGQPEVREHPAAGEVIYMDTATREVFCRAWCWKNGDTSKLTPETKRCAINIDGMLPAFTIEQLVALGREAAEMLKRFTGAETEVRLMSPETPEFSIN
ncbi:hypothetical protein C4J81_05570 [Deltaproteobacteria bacterium Smac51]|nr:hypothetical protein C4J81_05570 [Deltaproteobacteria bacterium Smac51]